MDVPVSIRGTHVRAAGPAPSGRPVLLREGLCFDARRRTDEIHALGDGDEASATAALSAAAAVDKRWP